MNLVDGGSAQLEQVLLKHQRRPILAREIFMRSAPFQAIVVAVDSTQVSHQAFKKAVGMAKALDARLIITHVLSFRDTDSPRPIQSYSTPDTIVIDKAIRRQY